MRIAETEVFTFAELDSSAKENARNWYRASAELDTDCIFDDAVTIAGLLGISIATRSVPLMNGGTRGAPKIYWSGFASQGDGACFEGSYQYRKGAAKEVRAYAPQDKALHRIADGLQALQRKHFYSLQASVSHTGRYSHEYSTDIAVEDSRDSWRDIGTAEESVKDYLRDFMRWIYRALESEWDYINSDSQVDESIDCNGYEFTADGQIH